MRLSALIIWMALSVLAPLAPASAQDPDIKANRAEILRLLHELPALFSIREEMQAFGFRGEKLDLAVKQAELVYRDPVIAGYVADRVIEAYESPRSVAEADGLIWPLLRRGLAHLTTKELTYFFKVEKVMIENLSVRECGLMARSRLSPLRQSDAMTRMAARLNLPALKEYYRIQQKAARLGVSRPDAGLTPDAVARAGVAIFEEMNKRIAASEDAAVLRHALANYDTTSHANACRLTRMMGDVVLDQKGQTLRDALLFMVVPF